RQRPSGPSPLSSPPGPGVQSPRGDHAMSHPHRGDIWERSRAQLAGLPGGGLNIAHEAVGRHVAEGRGDRVAIRWLGLGDTRSDITYLELAERAARWANVFEGLGLAPGETAFTL